MCKCGLMNLKILEGLKDLDIRYDDTIYDHRELKVYRCSCIKCGQLYVSWVYEVYSPAHDEEYWSYWVPVTKKELEDIKKNPTTIIELTRNRRHIVLDCDGNMYYSNSEDFPFDGFLRYSGY